MTYRIANSKVGTVGELITVADSDEMGAIIEQRQGGIFSWTFQPFEEDAEGRFIGIGNEIVLAEIVR